MPTPTDPTSLCDEALRVQQRDLRASLVATHVLVCHLAASLSDPASDPEVPTGVTGLARETVGKGWSRFD